jgi:pilus assembly protein CpaB
MKSKVLMVMSLLLLGVALIGLMSSYFSAPAVKDTKSEARAINYEVWVAKSAITLGQKVKREDLRLKVIPQDEAFEKGIQADIKLQFVAGMVANTSLSEDQIVMPENITRPDQDGYFNLVMTPGSVPFPISVRPESIIGGVIHSGSKIDVLALTSMSQNLANQENIRDFSSISLAPVLMGVSVLQVNSGGKDGLVGKLEDSMGDSDKNTKVGLILELTPKQVATITIARHIAGLEVHLSTGLTLPSELSANAGDVMSGYRSIREFRAETATAR